MIYVLIISIQVGSLRETYRWTEHATRAECVAAGENERASLLEDRFDAMSFMCRREKKQ